ncbi:hypothetical protein H0H92_009711 [Tricholoma furcatifolium]|nr:hypothetical protein H0H92_009711 [Tricholoma furcatifolium]
MRIHLGFKQGFPHRLMEFFRRKSRADTPVSPVDTTSMPDINSFSSQAGQLVRFGLNFACPIAGAVPVAGGPLKAAIGALLFVFNNIDQMSQNKKDVETLIIRLHEFDESIKSMPPTTGIAQSQREKLIQDLDAVAKYLKDLPVTSFLRNNDVTQLIQGCIRKIDEHERRCMYKEWFLAYMDSCPLLSNEEL